MKYTVDFIVEYFSHYNTQLYIDYEELVTTVLPCQEELEEVFNFLNSVRNENTDNYVNTYYFRRYFNYTHFGEKTAALNVTQLLVYAIGELKSFKEDFEIELHYYEGNME